MATTAPAVDGHPVPADEDETAVAVAAVLTAGAGAAATAAEISFILAPWRVTPAAVRLALKLADTSHRAYARLASNDIPTRSTGVAATIARTAAREEVFSRAAYVMAASSRLQASFDEGRTEPEAAAAERANYLRHGLARAKRLDAAAKTGRAAEQFGPLLGWYRDPESNSERECREADGNNFYADEGTVIGYPGAVHPHCRCVAGPPHRAGAMVNDALLGVIRLEPRKVGVRMTA